MDVEPERSLWSWDWKQQWISIFFKRAHPLQLHQMKLISNEENMENENEAVAVTVPNQATELSYDYVFGGWWVKVL